MQQSLPQTKLPQRTRQRPVILLAIIFIIVVALVIWIASLFFNHKITLVPGQVTYDASLTTADHKFLEPIFNDAHLAYDVTITRTTTYHRTTPSNDYLLYDIQVPVADFYYPGSNIDQSALLNSAVTSSPTESSDQSSTPSDSVTTPQFQLISITSLTPTQKLLSLDHQYFFDDFEHGAIFAYYQFHSDNPSEAIDLVQPHLSTLPTATNTLSFAQTGVTALTRQMLLKLQQVGDGAYFAANIKDFLSSKDLTHISNEVSFDDTCSNRSSTALCADWRMLSAIQAIGTDIVELTGNHNNDWGTASNLATINKYTELGLKTFGGGSDESTAALPLQLTIKNTPITLLGYNYSTSTKANGQGAEGTSPGANIYDATAATQAIQAAKARGDFIIVDIQYFECYSYPDYGEEMPECDYPISGQADFFRQFVDQGADIVIGTQAHQPQTYELYHDKPIYYGLGNLFFDQTYWPGTTRSLILTHYFIDGQYVQTRLTPTVYDTNYQPTLMNEETSQWFIQRLNQAR